PRVFDSSEGAGGGGGRASPESKGRVIKGDGLGVSGGQVSSMLGEKGTLAHGTEVEPGSFEVVPPLPLPSSVTGGPSDGAQVTSALLPGGSPTSDGSRAQSRSTLEPIEGTPEVNMALGPPRDWWLGRDEAGLVEGDQDVTDTLQAGKTRLVQRNIDNR
ncbi:unnamed protein product, partial [Discosporangium mesarthrocarpum]